VLEHEGRKYVFCSEPCRWIFSSDRERYADHKDIVQRVLSGEAPGNIVEFLTRYSGLCYDEWGKDAFGGVYPWMPRGERR
jgi:toluene monooxygenase system protein A